MEITKPSVFNSVAPQGTETNPETTDATGPQSAPQKNPAADAGPAVPPDGTPVTRSKNLPLDSAVPASIALQLSNRAQPRQDSANSLIARATDPTTGVIDTGALARTLTGLYQQDPNAADQAYAGIQRQLAGNASDRQRFNQDFLLARISAGIHPVAPASDLIAHATNPSTGVTDTHLLASMVARMDPLDASAAYAGIARQWACEPGNFNRFDESLRTIRSLNAGAGRIKPAQSGLDNMVGAAKAYMNRDDVSLSQAASAAWNGGGKDLVAGIGHSLGAGFASYGAVVTSPTILGSIGLGALAAQQTDAAVADYRRFFGRGDERGAQPLLTQGLTPLIGQSNAATVSAGIDFAYGVGVVGRGLRQAENQVLKNTTYRAMTAQDAANVERGLGMTAKNPNGPWTAEEHVLNFSRRVDVLGNASQNNPWIGTSYSYGVADAYRRGLLGTDAGNGIAAINLGKVPAQNQVEVWMNIDRSTTTGEIVFHRSFWAQEVTIYRGVPQEAIYTPFSPINQVPVYKPVTQGLIIGGAGLAGKGGDSK